MKYLMVAALISTLSACSKVYRPASETEAVFFKSANYCLFPNDVRGGKVSGQTLFAWPGILSSISSVPKDTLFQVDLVIEHHYYDWVLDFGAQPERFFLSPKGEGLFKAHRQFHPKRDSVKINRPPKVGDMFIVYGECLGQSGDTILVDAKFIRTVDKKWYTTEILEYERLGCTK